MTVFNNYYKNMNINTITWITLIISTYDIYSLDIIKLDI